MSFRKYYIDKRAFSNGRSSHINMDNSLDLSDYIATVVTGGSASTLPLTFTNAITKDAFDTVKLGGSLIENTIIDVNSFDYIKTYDTGTITVTEEFRDDFIAGPADMASPFSKGHTFFVKENVSDTVYSQFASYMDVSKSQPFIQLNTSESNNEQQIRLGGDEITLTNLASATSQFSKYTSTPTDITIESTLAGDHNSSVEVAPFGTIIVHEDLVTTNSVRISLLPDDGTGDPGIKLDGLPSFDDDADAATAGLISNYLYVSTGVNPAYPAGILMIKQ